MTAKSKYMVGFLAIALIVTQTREASAHSRSSNGAAFAIGAFAGVVIGSLLADSTRGGMYANDQYAMSDAGYRSLNSGYGTTWNSGGYAGSYSVRSYRHPQGYECRRLGHRTYKSSTRRAQGKVRYQYFCRQSHQADWVRFNGKPSILIAVNSNSYSQPGYIQQPQPQFINPQQQVLGYDSSGAPLGYANDYDAQYDTGFSNPYGNDPAPQNYSHVQPRNYSQNQGYVDQSYSNQNDPAPSFDRSAPAMTQIQPRVRQPAPVAKATPSNETSEPVYNDPAPSTEVKIKKKKQIEASLSDKQPMLQKASYDPAPQEDTATFAADEKNAVLVMQVGKKTLEKMVKNLEGIEDDETRFKYLEQILQSMREYAAKKSGEMFLDKKQAVKLAKTFGLKEKTKADRVAVQKKAAAMMADSTRNFAKTAQK